VWFSARATHPSNEEDAGEEDEEAEDSDVLVAADVVQSRQPAEAVTDQEAELANVPDPVLSTAMVAGPVVIVIV
jgi:hypothetical protein